MNLLLWRHATAEDATEPGIAADLARPLSKRGHRQAAHVAEWLQKHLPADHQVLVSPAVRTRETASALTRDYRIVDELAPGADAEAVIAAANWPDQRGTIVIVGHQPTLGRVAAKLLGGREDDWSVKKGAVWWIASRDREEGQGVILRAVVSPDLV
jgi:phosphohistidine phosphatase